MELNLSPDMLEQLNQCTGIKIDDRLGTLVEVTIESVPTSDGVKRTLKISIAGRRDPDHFAGRVRASPLSLRSPSS